MKNNIVTVILLFILITVSAGLSQSSAYQVIVNAENPVSQLTREHVSDMMLKKVSKWQDGQKVMPVDLEIGSDTRETFSESVHSKNGSAIKAYWQKMIFTGKGIPPVEKSSDAEVVEFVKSNPGAIGYVSPRADISGVKVIKVNK